jgi:hypothetical protein
MTQQIEQLFENSVSTGYSASGYYAQDAAGNRTLITFEQWVELGQMANEYSEWLASLDDQADAMTAQMTGIQMF